MQITVDDREREAEVLEHLRAVPDVEAVVRRPWSGDYDVGGRVVFEGKVLQDFATSVVDGRLSCQARRLANGQAKPVCILEGPPPVLARRGRGREVFQGAPIALSLVFGIPVLRSAGPAETAHLIRYSARQLIRRGQGIVKRNRPGLRRLLQLHVLQGLLRVGVEKAGRPLDHFGSVEDVTVAEEEELCEVRGIGPDTAHVIRWALGRGGACPEDIGPMGPVGPVNPEA